ncbi:hypothetical protein CKO09_07530 [Chromatium weissei]|nr:hypothetical protein [Chromatium weissei]
MNYYFCYHASYAKDVNNSRHDGAELLANFTTRLEIVSTINASFEGKNVAVTLKTKNPLN